MYRLLVVDPDKNSRESIGNIIDDLGYDIAVTKVSDINAALEFATFNCVDVVLTELDIQDGEDEGFTLVEQIKTINKDLKFVFMSSKDDFSAVKKAMKMGAIDYLHKPFEKEDLIEAVECAIDKCEENKIINEQSEMNKEFISEHVIFSLIYGKKISEIYVEGEEKIERADYDKYKQLILIEFDEEFFNKVNEKFISEIENLLSTNGIVAKYCNLNAHQSVLLLDEVYTSEKTDEELINDCELIRNKISVRYCKKCFLAISSKIEKCDNLSIAMEEAEELMENKFYESDSKVFYKTKTEESPIFVPSDDDSIVKRIKQDIKLKDIDNMKSDFEMLWERYGNRKNLSQLYIKFIFSSILKSFYEVLPDVNEVDLNNEIDKLYRAVDLRAVKEIMNINIQRMEENFNGNNQVVHREVEHIKQYIYNNYKEEIGVEQLAEMVYMAPSYLSCVFKKETGQNLSKFIKSVRMEKAKDLLENSHMKIVNISAEVGYPNTSYFCQSFREYFGVSPQKFRTNGNK